MAIVLFPHDVIYVWPLLSLAGNSEFGSKSLEDFKELEYEMAAEDLWTRFGLRGICLLGLKFKSFDLYLKVSTLLFGLILTLCLIFFLRPFLAPKLFESLFDTECLEIFQGNFSFAL